MAVYSKHRLKHHNGKKLLNGRLKKSLAHLGSRIEKDTSSVVSKIDRKTTKFISRQPYSSMGIVMLAGVCLGYIMHRND